MLVMFWKLVMFLDVVDVFGSFWMFLGVGDVGCFWKLVMFFECW